MSSMSKKAVICMVATFGSSVALLFAFIGAPASAEGAGEVIGRLFALTGIAALLVRWQAGKAQMPWSWPKFALIYLFTVVCLLVLAAQGRAHAADAALAYHVTWPQDWTVKHLQGASNAPQDAQLGSREIGTQDIDGKLAAAIGVTCIPWETESRPDLQSETQKVFESTKSGHETRGFKVTASTPVAATVGKYAARQFEVTAATTAGVLKQRILLSFTAGCYMSVIYSANEATYATYLSTFEEVKRSIE